MLKNHLGSADLNTFAAVGAFFFDYYHSAIFALVNRFLRTDFLAFTALNTDAGLVGSRLRKERFYAKGRFFGIDFVKMMNTANLRAKAATGAI